MANAQFTIQLGLNSSGVTSGVNSAIGQIQKLAGQVKGALIGASLGGLVANEFRKAVQLGGDIADSARRAGMGVEAFQELTFAAKQSGVEMSDVSDTFKKMQVSQVAAIRGNQDIAASYGRIGLSVEQLRKLKPGELYKEIASRTGKMPHSAELTSDIAQIFGKGDGGMKMLSAFRDGFGEAAESAKSLGQVMEESVIKNLDKIGDTIDQLKGSWIASLGEMISKAIDFGKILKDSIESRMTYYIAYNDARKHGATESEAEVKAKRVEDSWFERRRKESLAKPVELARPVIDASGVRPTGNANAMAKPDSDTLARIGGFRGGGGEITRMPQLQLQAQQTANAHLSTISKTTAETVKATNTLNSYLSMLGVQIAGGSDE